MIGFLVFLLAVCAAGFIYLLFQSRWQVKDAAITSTIGTSKVEHFDDSVKITAEKINLHGAVAYEEANSNLPKSAPRINQAHWQTRTFERPRRKK